MTSGPVRVGASEDHPPYVLAGCHGDPRAPVLVAVHGISRNAEEVAQAFHGPASRAGWAVVCPLFDAQHFPDYQRLGRRGRRADLALLAVLADYGTRRGAPPVRFALFGFSGGAQFAHRFALAWPAVVGELFLTAAGWYTWPDPRLPFPRGTGRCRRLPDLFFHPEALVRRPIRVFVGEADVVRDEALRTDPWVDATQGYDRLERARRWCAALGAFARARGIPADVRLHLLPGTGHDFADAADPARGGLARAVFAELGGPTVEDTRCVA